MVAMDRATEPAMERPSERRIAVRRRRGAARPRTGTPRRGPAAALAVALARAAALACLAALSWALAQSRGGGWSTAPALPTPRSEMQAVVADGTVYVPGGLGPDRALAVVEAFDPATGAWRAAPPLPEPVHHAGVAAADGRVYVTGGYPDLRFVPTAAAWAFDPDDGAWTRLPDLPGPRAGHALVEQGGVLHVLGGIGRRSQAVWRFDVAEGRWIGPAAPLPTVREHLAAVALDGRIWAIGGRWGERGNLGTVEVYDPVADAWTASPDLPTPRSGLTAGAACGRIHVVGGESLSGSRTLPDHEVFDPAAGAWLRAAPLAPARHGLASAVVDGRWYVIGGATRAGSGTFGSLVGRVDVWHAGACDPS